MSGVKGSQGKFINQFDEETERISARILKSQAEQLRELLEPDQKISELIRDAIALYLKSKT